ncbi:MAG TPA: hypothetical protein VIC28_09520 [Thermoanaerobaculia bacterium]
MLAAPRLAAAAEARIVPAERAVLQRVLAESKVQQVPEPPQASYLGELSGMMQRALMNLLAKGSKMLNLPRPVYQAIALGLAALAVLLLLQLLVPRLRRRKVRRTEGDIAEIELPPAARSAAAWRAELERRLGEGHIAEALEALWWWLARSLAAGQAEPAWTSRDLVVRSRREDLRDLVRRLDAFTYGPRRPAVEELRRLVGGLEEALS